MNKIIQSTPTDEKYRKRWGEDCPGATGDPKRTLQSDGVRFHAEEVDAKQLPVTLSGAVWGRGNSPPLPNSSPNY